MSRSFTFEEGMQSLKTILELREEDFKYREADNYEQQMVDKQLNETKKRENIKIILICPVTILAIVFLFYTNISLLISVLVIWLLIIMLSIISNSKKNLVMTNGRYTILLGRCIKKDYSRRNRKN